MFVDTGAFYAAFVADDPDHGRAESLFDSPGDRLLTTDYVIDELLTLLKVRGHAATAYVLGERLFADRVCQVVFVLEQDIRNAWTFFDQYRDKAWGFTDCVSRVVMERLGIKKAFAFDDHFGSSAR